MKRYKITKVFYAKNIKEALLIEKDKEIVDICLEQDIESPEGNKIGFKR